MKTFKFLLVFLVSASFASASLINGIDSSTGSAGTGVPPGGGYAGATSGDYWVGLSSSMTVDLDPSATGYVVTLFDYDQQAGLFDVYEINYTGLATPFTGDAATDGQPTIPNTAAYLSSGSASPNFSYGVPLAIPSGVSQITVTNPGVSSTNLGIFYFDVCAAAVPEPSALLTLGFAGMPLAGLAWFRRRRAALEA